jgi:hypothetical protein
MYCSRCGNTVSIGIVECPACGLHVPLQQVVLIPEKPPVVKDRFSKRWLATDWFQRWSVKDWFQRWFAEDWIRGLLIALILSLLIAVGILVGLFLREKPTTVANSHLHSVATFSLTPSPTPIPSMPATVYPTEPENSPTPVMPSPRTTPEEYLQDIHAPTPDPPQRRPIAKGAFTVAAQQFLYWQFEVSKPSRVTGEFSATGGRNDVEVYIMNTFQYMNFNNNLSTPTFYNSGRATARTIDVALPSGSYWLVINNRFSIFTPKAVTVDIDLE